MWESISNIIPLQYLSIAWVVLSILVPFLRATLRPAEGSVGDKVVSVIEGVFIDLSKIVKSATGNPLPGSQPPGSAK